MSENAKPLELNDLGIRSLLDCYRSCVDRKRRALAKHLQAQEEYRLAELEYDKSRAELGAQARLKGRTIVIVADGVAYIVPEPRKGYEETTVEIQAVVACR